MTPYLPTNMFEQTETQLINPTDEQWLKFVTLDSDCNIFHHPAWLNLLAECYGYRPFILVLRDPEGSIRMGLPMMEIRTSLTSKHWVSLPFTDHCRPVNEDDECLQQLTNWLNYVYKESTYPRIEVRTELSPHPAVWINSNYVLHTLGLEKDVELLLSQVHRMHWRNIKYAEKRGVHVECGNSKEHLEMYYQLHLCTRHRQGMPVQPKRFFHLLGRLIINRGLGFVLLAYKDNECIAGAVFLHWQRTLTYKYGASNMLGRDYRANNLLMWTGIRWGCENGYVKLDMGRTSTTNTGLRKYKSRWGAVEEPLIYSIFADKSSDLMDGKSTAVMQKVIRNSPSWVCRIVGELFYRHVA